MTCLYTEKCVCQHEYDTMYELFVFFKSDLRYEFINRGVFMKTHLTVPAT